MDKEIKKINPLKHTGFPYNVFNKIIDTINNLIDNNSSLPQTYELIANKKNTFDNLKGSDYPTSILVKDSLANVMEVAEGKSRAFVSSTQVHSELNSVELTVYVNAPLYDENGQPIYQSMDDVKIGDIIYVKEIQNEVGDYIPDRWVSGYDEYGIFLSALNTSKTDLNNYVDSRYQGHKVLHIWKGRQAEYDNLETIDANTLYITYEPDLEPFYLNIYTTPLTQISFSYEPGMNWNEWVNSEFNNNLDYPFSIDEEGFVRVSVAGDIIKLVNHGDTPETFIKYDDIIDGSIEYAPQTPV